MNVNTLIITPAGKLNGTAKTFTTWIKNLNQSGHKIYLYSGKGNLARWTGSYCEKQYFFEVGIFEPSFFRFLRIKRIVKFEKIDVIWGVGTTSSLLGALVGVLTKTKYLNILNVSPRQHIWPENPKWKYPFVGHNVTVSEHFCDLLVYDSKIPDDFCHFIPARFDLDELNPVFPEDKKLENKKLTISILRRFDKQKVKGISLFLKFIEKYNNNLVGYKFNLYGDGDSAGEVNTLVNKLNKSGVNIKNYGFVKDIKEIIINSDIIIGSERVAIESILCGRPVCIIGDNGIINFVTENNVELFKSDNFSGLGNSGKSILNPEETSDLFNNYEKLLSICNLQYCHDEIAKTYDSKIGIRKLIQLSKIADPYNDRFKKIYRILFAIIMMYGTKIRSKINNRLFVK